MLGNRDGKLEMKRKYGKNDNSPKLVLTGEANPNKSYETKSNDPVRLNRRAMKNDKKLASLKKMDNY